MTESRLMSRQNSLPWSLFEQTVVAVSSSINKSRKSKLFWLLADPHAVPESLSEGE